MPTETDDKNHSLFDVVPPAARLADTVTQSIADALLEGRIAPGEALPSEGEIARTFGVSKPIAREALRQLAGVGLIHTQQGKVARAKALNGEPLERFYGFAVRSSLTRLQEANEMRRVVETGIAQLAAQRRNDEGLEQMRAATSKMRSTMLHPHRFTECDIEFHLGMARATGNSMIVVQMEGLGSIQREVSELFTRRSNRSAADWEKTIERHEAVLKAIVEGDEEAVAVAIRDHYAAADIASLEVADILGENSHG
ncbi:FadR/GntR family transcriptional regulator [Nitratireductor basaltis]|uniref:GntR family transcriptional regulator n=1 Tax=Nitratireductor basaltis TaxID=472175 RepID=A0A084U8S7_9HYPH|nr:FCD domain-containing protein [Nitratireductor basaltis]KFB09363.1 GntR family transcriptional regulator [Nitratireductor basaltis]